MLFDSWGGLARVLVVGTAAYAMLIVFLRVSGKRTLSKMNAFDLVVTVALGSTLATVLLSRSVPLAEGVLALALLICLQFVLTWASVRSRSVRDLIKSEPALLVRDGVYLEGAMRKERMTREEIDAALRESGVAALSGVSAVVLETDGSLSVIESGDARR
ncbi:YetF domain-containing protein [Parvibaculum sp.]